MWVQMGGEEGRNCNRDLLSEEKNLFQYKEERIKSLEDAS